MTLSLPRTGRLGVFALSMAYAAATIGTLAAPAPAMAGNGPYYTAELATPADDNRAVASGIAWACKGNSCVANKGQSRPLRICRGLNREFGEIVSFSFNGEQLADEKLAKCNGN